MIYKCKMCGGTLEIAEGVTVCECDYCGTTQTIPATRDEVVSNLFNRANNLRMRSEFDKAQEIYEKIVAQNADEAEAYWGIILCKYGIEYVVDPATLKKIPTCHRTQLESVFTDVDYIAAIEHCDIYQRSVYEEEARAIDVLQKNILEIVRKEKPFDVFICYKETDENGHRTPDSVIANDIYHQLAQEGIKTFYAAITLEDKLGQEYEPYIFAALTSAKVMLVVGTRPEYFTAVWVKNEWSRFIKLMKTDRSKLLIPCYRDMDAYDLPEEFSHLQAQNMSKIGFINDIIRGIKKVTVKAETPQPTVVKETVVQSAPVNNNAAPLLKRAAIFLSDGDWNSANEYCEKVLDIDPENAQAYFYKLLSKMKAHSEKTALESYLTDFLDDSLYITNDPDYKKSYRFGNMDMKAKLNDLHCSMIYNSAKRAISYAKTDEDYQRVAKGFRLIKDYKDSSDLIMQCEESANEYLYQKALKAFESAETSVDYDHTAELFRTITGSKDSNGKLIKCSENAREYIYQSAVESLKNAETQSDYKIALNILSYPELKGYRDTKALKEKCIKYSNMQQTYEKALSFMNGYDLENVQKAMEMFKSIPGFKNADEKAEECRQQREAYIALNLQQARFKRIGRIAAVSCVVLVGAYIFIETIILPMIKYNDAIELADSGRYTEAAVIFGQLGNYKDSSSRLILVNSTIDGIKKSKENFVKAEDLKFSGKYTDAIAMYKMVIAEDAEHYALVDNKISECKKAIADKALSDYAECIANSDYNGALKLLAGIGEEYLTDELRSKNAELKEEYLTSMKKGAGEYFYKNDYLGAIDYINENRIDEITDTQIDDLYTRAQEQYVKSVLDNAQKLSDDKKYEKCLTYLKNSIAECEEYGIDSSNISSRSDEMIKLYTDDVIAKADKKASEGDFAVAKSMIQVLDKEITETDYSYKLTEYESMEEKAQQKVKKQNEQEHKKSITQYKSLTKTERVFGEACYYIHGINENSHFNVEIVDDIAGGSNVCSRLEINFTDYFGEVSNPNCDSYGYQIICKTNGTINEWFSENSQNTISAYFYLDSRSSDLDKLLEHMASSDEIEIYIMYGYPGQVRWQEDELSSYQLSNGDISDIKNLWEVYQILKEDPSLVEYLV